MAPWFVRIEGISRPENIIYKLIYKINGICVIEPWISVATKVISQWFPCPKILFPMKHWEMATHGVSWPEISATMVKSFVVE